MATFPTRREPPTFRDGTVVSTEPAGGDLVRLDLRFEDLSWLADVDPAASVRLLLPSATGLEVPIWDGNEFLLADGTRPRIRTLTPVEVDIDSGRLTLLVLRHDRSPLTDWLDRCVPGERVAVSGPGRGQVIDPAIADYVLVGDDAALPAIITLLRAIPHTSTIRVLIETTAPTAPDRPELPRHPGADIDRAAPLDGPPPGSWLVDRVAETPLTTTTLLWAAGEAAAMQRIRRSLDRGVAPRSLTVVRGYWKVERQVPTAVR